eukprot:g1860.t1
MTGTAHFLHPIFLYHVNLPTFIASKGSDVGEVDIAKKSSIFSTLDTLQSKILNHFDDFYEKVKDLTCVIRMGYTGVKAGCDYNNLYYSYQNESPTWSLENDPTWLEVREYILEGVNFYAKGYGFESLEDLAKRTKTKEGPFTPFDSDTPKDIGTLMPWATVSVHLGSHALHDHPGSSISGILYLDLPDGSSDIGWIDPRSNVGEEVASISLAPQAGDLILFPSWLKHEVFVSFFKDEKMRRVALPFNIGGDWSSLGYGQDRSYGIDLNVLERFQSQEVFLDDTTGIEVDELLDKYEVRFDNLSNEFEKVDSKIRERLKHDPNIDYHQEIIETEFLYTERERALETEVVLELEKKYRVSKFSPLGIVHTLFPTIILQSNLSNPKIKLFTEDQRVVLHNSLLNLRESFDEALKSEGHDDNISLFYDTAFEKFISDTDKQGWEKHLAPLPVIKHFSIGMKKLIKRYFHGLGDKINLRDYIFEQIPENPEDKYEEYIENLILLKYKENQRQWRNPDKNGDGKADLYYHLTVAATDRLVERKTTDKLGETISGIYFVHVPSVKKGNSATWHFKDMRNQRIGQDIAEFVVIPKTADVLIYPSWLRHEVIPRPRKSKVGIDGKEEKFVFIEFGFSGMFFSSDKPFSKRIFKHTKFPW